MNMQQPDPRSLHISEYSYELPDARIARYPLEERDAARLLVYRNGKIEEDIFHNLGSHLPKESTLVLNTAKVVRARMLFRKPTGGVIEIFCLEPHAQYADITTAMASKGQVLWQCLVGGAAKWKEGTTLDLQAGSVTLHADLVQRNKTDFTIHFHWTPKEYTWAEVMEQAGQVPLPPYLGRAAETKDESSYQTLFALHEGSVAAPTASLHFTPRVLNELNELGVRKAQVTLHVGAGTFKPVKADVIGEHEMHEEWIEISRDTITQLKTATLVVAAGTTALRTLESLYWLGCKALGRPDISPKDMAIAQWEVYQMESGLSKSEALEALEKWMEASRLQKLVTRTGILIAPGYKFRMADGLITNFHQPRSTLLLLIAAFIGDDWKEVYNYALSHNFRFLSYGDASLLWRKDS
jgi:S-adenosylmethionine:tRNA ribosyltransferase-isomerase